MWHVFGFSFHYEVKRLCLVKLTLDKSVCFAPVTLSLSVDFSGPDRDPKRVEGNFLFLPHRAAAIQCRGHRGGPAVPGCLWSCQFSQGLGEGGSLRSPLPGVLSAVCTAGRGGSTEPGHSSPVRRSCSGQWCFHLQRSRGLMWRPHVMPLRSWPKSQPLRPGSMDP